MDLEQSIMEVEPDSPARSPEAIEDAPMTEPSISFDFVSTDFEFPSTDEGSQDIANAALLALSEENPTDEQMLTEPVESQPLEETHDGEKGGDGEQPLEVAHEAALEEAPKEKSPLPDADATLATPDSIFVLPSDPKPTQIEVAIPELTDERRAEYSTVESDVIEAVFDEEVIGTGDVSYRIMYADGREDQVSFLQLAVVLSLEAWCSQ